MFAGRGVWRERVACGRAPVRRAVRERVACGQAIRLLARVAWEGLLVFATPPPALIGRVEQDGLPLRLETLSIIAGHGDKGSVLRSDKASAAYGKTVGSNLA